MSHRHGNTLFRSLDEVREEALEPHARLMLAVLEEALMTFQAGLHSRCPQRRRRSVEAADWFRSRDFDSLFSFEHVCAVLGLNPDYLRLGIHRLKTKSITSPVPVPVTRIRRSYAGLDFKRPILGAGAA